MVYEKTETFIFEITARRLKNRMKQLDKNYYNIMGYNSETDYGDDGAIYNYEMVQRIVYGRRNRDNTYLQRIHTRNYLKIQWNLLTVMTYTGELMMR